MATASLMAAWVEGDMEQGFPGGVPRLMLITLAGVGLREHRDDKLPPSGCRR